VGVRVVWQHESTNFRCNYVSGNRMLNVNSLACTVPKTGGHGQIDTAVDPYQECIYFICSETLPSACYILLNESSIPF